MSSDIQLSRGEVAIVDDENFEELSQSKWHCDKQGYAVRGDHEYMHRIIMNAPKGMTVDHINGDKLDNRRENLRLCEHAENMRNMKKHKDNKSGYKGVSWNKYHKRWVATIGFNYEHIRIGFFDNIHDAARAYNERAKELFGEFASINEVTDGKGNFHNLAILQYPNSKTLAKTKTKSN